ncbi:MAG TPA: protein kinase [Polyangia bacterium]|jgi:formylglycine-generating enzyme required for sulfatase activity|nr:protein kinase [Polyangia bacterium]
MARSSTNGKGEDGTIPSPTAAVVPDVSTHESSPGEGSTNNGDLDILARGAVVGRYLVLERLGAGAMGVVYAAYDPELDRKIALKLLRPQAGNGDTARRRARLVREAKATAKLSHPNVVGIFDVGVHQGQVFLAMEYLGGGTLRQWLDAEKRPWREIVRIFIEVGNGLAAAHAEGLIHRDFKPDNVLVDKQGKPKVVDFGLVRLASASLEASTTDSLDVDTTQEADAGPIPADQRERAALTRTGALAGTPAYMAPEQFLGKAIDERTDQFAFCVALYEALYRKRPFAGETVLGLADSVTSGQIIAATNPEIPASLRRIVVKGLAREPGNRFESIDSLLRALGHDPTVVFRRRATIGIALLVISLAGWAVQRGASRRQRELDRRIGEHVAESERDGANARAAKTLMLELRKRAFQAFDEERRDDGERVWAEARAEAASVDAALERAEQQIGAALTLDKERRTLRDQLGEVIYERALLAEIEFRKPDVRRHLDRISEVDPSGRLRKRWVQPGALTLQTAAPLPIALERYVDDPSGKRRPVVTLKSRTPLLNQIMEPGSYRAALEASNGQQVFYPFVIRRDERLVIHVDLPAVEKIPAGFAYVPAGEFLFGEADDSLRTSFLDTVPIHPARTGSYLIARNEETYERWIAFLESLPPAAQDKRAPFVSTHRDYLRLQRSKGSWWLELRPSMETFTARRDQPITYPGRTVRSQQRWTRMPVGGISVDDIEAFLGWLSHEVPGARLCTDKEWERAARGADDRIFPHGDVLGADDANFDLTYGRRPLGFGPDEVGRYQASTSPFGVEDMAGNLLEITQTGIDGKQFVARGGGYYYDRRSARLTNREPVERNLRYPTFGFRVCADPTFN